MWTDFFWTYLVGPLAALLPARWRSALPSLVHADWERAGTLSGILEMLAAIIGLGYWYMLEMTRRIDQIMNGTVHGKTPVGLTEHQVQGAALTIFYMGPLTWILFYFFFEGAFRLCGAAFTENVLGTLPLYLLERTVFLVRHRKQAKLGELVARNVLSFVASVREQWMVARLEEVPDELHYTTSGTEPMLEVWASRRKQEWVSPKIVRVDELYYRLEESWVEKGSRPFRYRLRQLEAGVPARNVILYKTEQAIVKE
ncbi:MAG: hypothetical protein WBR26_07055 [Candidatus Acidiferrum sp.]